jgi:hypothetical protein
MPIMPSHWRDDLNAGRRRIRDALDGRRPSLNQRAMRPHPPAEAGADRDEPFINVQLYDDSAGSEQRSTATLAAENESLRGMLGELSTLAETAVARVGELEPQLAETREHADRMIEVLELPGVRRMLVRMAHPDAANPGADDNERRARTEASSKINAVYDWIDRTKKPMP